MSATFAMDNVGCAGSEAQLWNCSYNSQDDCGAGEGAGVTCDTRPAAEIEAEQELIR